ncbi:FAD-dependent oxidoreductase [Chengkuizengella axinellae]|uniref:FAD-dependent oxidoreductase n=1 Tax=Chengkuizengella axinellae TaxID=3064388 RepID=A0ABT9J3I3_9BACL|nr:FAD-dependent oxidoreductase [Chengkuizengella sp. 2205SS18-9]MDP5276043.1 FAD-dependent oxidoreductase [Chengkuizengella sp. 2205SS18-9]
MKLLKLKGLFKKTFLEVASVVNPYDDYYLIKLKLKENTKWIPGEHAIFTLPDRVVDGKKWRSFSIASIEKEGHMLIGIRTGRKASSFKKNLIEMKEGERVGVRGPFGGFKISDTSSPLVLIASRVGVTPIRSLLKEIENKTKRQVNIVYTSTNYHLFREELNEIAEKNSNINLYMMDGKKPTQTKIKHLAKQFGSDAYYYISGSMPIIKSVKSLLKEEGIKKNKIINDPFYGY